MTADQVAAALGVARMSIYNYEGARGSLTAAMIGRLAQFYGVEETDLVKPFKPAPSADLEEMIDFMRDLHWTPTRLDVLRSVLTGFATSAEKRALETVEKVRNPSKERK